MEPTPALWIVFFVALLIATFDNGEFPRWPKLSAMRGAIKQLGNCVDGLLRFLYHTPHAPRPIRTLPVSNTTTGRQAERGDRESL